MIGKINNHHGATISIMRKEKESSWYKKKS